MLAQFDSECPACGELIYQGDAIAPDPETDEFMHEECVEFSIIDGQEELPV